MRINARGIFVILFLLLPLGALCAYFAQKAIASYENSEVRANRESEMSDKHLERNLIRQDYVRQMEVCRELAIQIMDPANRAQVNGYNEKNIVNQFCEAADNALLKGSHSSWDLLENDAPWVIAKSEEMLRTHNLRHYSQTRLNLTIQSYKEILVKMQK